MPIRSVALILTLLLACSSPADRGIGAELLSEHVWHHDDPGFGGFSGLEVWDQGRAFAVIGDRGAIATGRFTRSDETITGVTGLRLEQLRRPDGDEVTQKQRDAEGLARAADGTLFVSFEGQHRVWAYPDPFGPAEPLPTHPDFAALQLNSGLEALAIDDTGALFTLPERSGHLSRPFPLYRYDDAGWTIPWQIPRRGDYLPVGADFGPDGRLYLLERLFSGLLGFSSRIRRFSLDADGTVAEETLLTTPNLRHGNLEGLAVWRDDAGAIRLTMIADDNFVFYQNTAFVEYRVTD